MTAAPRRRGPPRSSGRFADITLAPLLQAGPVVVLHTVAALVAFLIGLLQDFGSKGTTAHRIFGWSWVLLLGTVAVSSFWIHGLRLVGPFSPIHLLSVLVLIMLPLGVVYARRHRVSGHKKTMGSIFFGTLVVARSKRAGEAELMLLAQPRRSGRWHRRTLSAKQLIRQALSLPPFNFVDLFD